MISQLLIDVVGWVLEAALDALDSIIPASWFGYIDTAFGVLGNVLSFTPGAILLGLIALTFAVDLALNAWDFIVSTYRLIPAKFT